MLNQARERLMRLLEAPPPATSEGRAELRRAFQEMDLALGEEIEQSIDRHQRELEAPVGPTRAAEMARRPEAARAGLADADADVRRLALFLLGRRHRHLLGEAPLLLRLIATDENVAVRRSAIFYLALEAEGTNDPAAGAALARLVACADEPAELRADAFRARVYLVGKAGRWEPSVPLLRFPDDIDWSLVRRFLPAEATTPPVTPGGNPVAPPHAADILEG